MRTNSRHEKAPALAGGRALDNEINFEEEIVMTDISTAVAKSNVIPFRSAMLLLVEHNGEPFVPMKPIADGMGLDWKTQHRKLTEGRFKSTMVEMTIVAADGKLREMTCMPLRKLAGWMMSIHPGKIQDDDRKKAIIEYQNECDDVLWSYWNEGHAVNHRSPDQSMTVLGQTIGTDGFHMLGAVVKGKVSSLPTHAQRRATAKIWSQTHAAFGVRSAADIPSDQLDAARNFIAAYVVLEGEYIQVAPNGGVSLDKYEASHLYGLMSYFHAMSEHREHMLSAARLLDSKTLMLFFDMLNEGRGAFASLDKRRDELYQNSRSLGLNGGYASRASA